MFKYSSINSYSLQNLFKSQIYFNNPLNFNDPFDTFHPATIGELSNEKFAALICEFYDGKFEEKIILEIINKTISKEDFIKFCDEHILYFLKFNKNHKLPKHRSKADYLNTISNEFENGEYQVSPEIEEVFNFIKSRLHKAIAESLNKIRIDSFSKVGVCCFSKNKENLLMWSHYADSHRGICLEFDDKLEPFSKNFEVIYKSDIPNLNSDLLFNENDQLESFRKLLSYKSEDWKHEEELRVLHQEKNKIFRYPQYALKAIYFGIRTNPTDKEMICSLVKSQTPEVRFFQMERLKSQFAIKPREFFYSTPVEVQSKLLTEIYNLFQNKKFEISQLQEKVKVHIETKNLKNHLNEMVRKGILNRSKEKYSVADNVLVTATHMTHS